MFCVGALEQFLSGKSKVRLCAQLDLGALHPLSQIRSIACQHLAESQGKILHLGKQRTGKPKVEPAFKLLCLGKQSDCPCPLYLEAVFRGCHGAALMGNPQHRAIALLAVLGAIGEFQNSGVPFHSEELLTLFWGFQPAALHCSALAPTE